MAKLDSGAVTNPGLSAPEMGTIGRLQGLIERMQDQEEATLREEARALDLILKQLRPLIATICPPSDPYYRPALAILEESPQAGLDKRLTLFDSILAEETNISGKTISGALWNSVSHRELSTAEAIRIYGFRRLVEALAERLEESSALIEGRLAALESRQELAKRLQEVLQGA